MPRVSFQSLPDDARLWIFGAERSLSSHERNELLSAVDGFLDDWRAHGSPLGASRDFREDRFLMVAVDQATVPPSGCSIDAMVDVLRQVEGRLGVALLGHGAIFYRDRSDVLSRTDRPGFKRLVEAGAVDGDTPVLDTTITSLGSLRAGGWELPTRESWHGRAFLRPAHR